MLKQNQSIRKWQLRGSLTVEASLLLPIFIFATLSVIYMNKFLLYQEQVQWALTRIGREAAVEYAVAEERVIPDQLYLTAKAALYLKDTDVTVSLLQSEFDEESKELHLVADYWVKLPFPLINIRSFVFSQQSVSRAFAGVDTRQMVVPEEEDSIVYITRTGRVFHETLSCTYLTLSISQVKHGDLSYLRSESGGIYHACEACAEDREYEENDEVYICNYGNRFHQSRSCSKLKRNIQEVQRSEVGSRLPCSKCTREEE